MMKDPVCGARLEELDTAIMTCFDGQILAFCCHRCLNEFSEDPEAYAPDEPVARAS